MPVENIENLFKPTSASVRELVADQVGGFEIPPYQRPYRWKPADVRRLIEDVVASLNRIPDDPHSVTFIGALITLSGVAGGHNSTPKSARRVIDGQQRLTTLSLLAVCLREELVGLPFEQWLKKAEGADVDEQCVNLVRALQEQAIDLKDNLMDCVVDSLSSGKGIYKHRPKIVRDMADRWGKKAGEAEYLSPVGHLLHSYAAADEESESFKLTHPLKKTLPEAVGSSREDHETIHRRFKDIKKYMKEMKQGLEGKHLNEYIIEESLFGGGGSLALLFPKTDLAEFASDMATFESVDSLEFPAYETARLLAFAECLLNRIVLTQIHATEESYAFDMFDSLNSTGEPLTAFETFVPLVVKAEIEEGEAYGDSESFRHISLIHKYVADGGDSIQRETTQFLTSFLLAELGKKISSHHNQQRAELQRHYLGSGAKLATSLSEKRRFTASMRDTAATYFEVWQDGELRSEGGEDTESLDDQASMCLAFLRKTNHRVVIAPLSRYVAEFWAEPSPARAETVGSIIKVCTAFSVLWRAAHGGTDGIDARYRSLMSEGIPLADLPPLSPRDDRGILREAVDSLPAPVEVGAGLRQVCVHSPNYSFESFDEWRDLVARRPVYDENETLTRFLLLLASHHARPGKKGLTVTGAKSDETDMLRPDRWADPRLATIEHVAPRSRPADGWSDDLYTDPSVIHRLGNLTLLPLDDNSSISNAPWPEKQWIYRILAADTPAESDKVAKQASKAGFPVSEDRMGLLLERRRHLPVLQATASYQGEWDANHIERRSADMLERAWKILDTWLTGKDAS